MHKLKWVSPTEPGSAPQPVTAANPRGAGRKPDGSRLAALARGDDRYWTPRLCRRVAAHNVDGLCERHTDRDSNCVQCVREANRRYKSDNPEKIRALQRAYQKRAYRRRKNIRTAALAAIATALGV